MTAERIKGLLTIQCDDGTCRNFFESSSRNFADAWGEAKREGWRANSVAGEWFHYCHECSKSQKPNIAKIIG